MIASVSGEVLVRRPDHVVIDTGGVGYRLSVSVETLKSVPAHGKWAMLHAQLVVRDDSMHLYGFASEEERDLFLHLNSVSGVGPKVAMAILSGGTPRDLMKAIALGDHKRFQAVPGVGKRTAERVIVELREKVAGELEQAAPALAGDGVPEPRLLARDGLVGLGYSLIEADRLLDGVEGESPEDLISLALRKVGDASGAHR
ncbi:MAG: Holliday junction branch migration protein RuvA [Actinomycetota bacterium]|nr:Holliday junction branch migration protein RuvA [Actinomycetota bacterium]